MRVNLSEMKFWTCKLILMYFWRKKCYISKLFGYLVDNSVGRYLDVLKFKLF